MSTNERRRASLFKSEIQEIPNGDKIICSGLNDKLLCSDSYNRDNNQCHGCNAFELFNQTADPKLIMVSAGHLTKTG